MITNHHTTMHYQPEQIAERLTLKGGIKNTIDEDMLSYVKMCSNAMRGIDRNNAVFVTGSGGVRGVFTRLELHRLKLETERDELLVVLKALLEHAENPGCSHEVELKLHYQPGWVECAHCYVKYEEGKPPEGIAVTAARAAIAKAEAQG